MSKKNNGFVFNSSQTKILTDWFNFSFALHNKPLTLFNSNRSISRARNIWKGQTRHPSDNGGEGGHQNFRKRQNQRSVRCRTCNQRDSHLENSTASKCDPTLRGKFYYSFFQNNTLLFIFKIIETSRQLFLIMEYASGGELFDYIVKRKRLQEEEACRFT